MKKLSLLFLILFSFSANAQFKDQTNKPLDVTSGIVKDYSSSLFSFFNPDNFKMRHTFDVSYQTSGFGNIALTTYTNSMFYKFNDQLNIEADVSLVNSPYNTFDKSFSQQLNGIYLSRAQLNYKPADNMTIILQYRNMPFNYYNSYWYNSPFYYDSFYNRESSNEKEK